MSRVVTPLQEKAGDAEGINIGRGIRFGTGMRLRSG